MKYILISIFLFITTGCLKEDEEITTPPTAVRNSLKVVVDSDFDKIPDAIDKFPNEASIPTIKIISSKTGFFETTLKHTNSNPAKFEKIRINNVKDNNLPFENYFSTRVKALQMQQNRFTRTNDPNEFFIKEKDENFQILTKWPSHEIYPFVSKLTSEDVSQMKNSSKVDLTYKLRLSSLDGVSQIDSVSYSLESYNKISNTFNVSKEFSLIDGNGSTTFSFDNLQTYSPIKAFKTLSISNKSQLLDGLKKQDEYGIRFIDFTFNRYGSKLKFSKFMSVIKSKLAKIIISTPLSTITYYRTPGVELNKFLMEKFVDINIDDEGYLTSLNGLNNSLSLNTDLSDLSNNELELGRWDIFGELDNGNQILKAGKTYLVSYGTARQITKSKKTTTEILSDASIKDSYLIENLREGDVLEISYKKLRTSLREEVFPFYQHCHASKTDPDRGHRVHVQGKFCLTNRSRIVPTGQYVVQYEEEYDLKIKIKGELLPITDFLKIGDRISHLEDNQVVKVRIPVTDKMMNDNRMIEIVKTKKPYDEGLSYGFVNYVNCLRPYFGCVLYDTSRVNYGGYFDDEIKINLKHHGFIR